MPIHPRYKSTGPLANLSTASLHPLPFMPNVWQKQIRADRFIIGTIRIWL